MPKFQSTPVIADGRIGTCASRSRPRWCFNPRPSLLTGESVRRVIDGSMLTLFQSTPVIADGRILAMCQVSREIAEVSIHARHC